MAAAHPSWHHEHKTSLRAVRDEIMAGLAEAGFGDLQPAHLDVFQHPGPHGVECMRCRRPLQAQVPSAVEEPAQHADPYTLLCTHFSLSATVRVRSSTVEYLDFWLVDAKYELLVIAADVNPQNS